MTSLPDQPTYLIWSSVNYSPHCEHFRDTNIIGSPVTMANVPTTEKKLDIIDLARGLNHTPWCEDYERMISGMLWVAPPVLFKLHHKACYIKYQLPINKPWILFSLTWTGKSKRYNPNSPKLTEARHRARCFTQDYNNFPAKSVTYDKLTEARLEVLKKLVGKVGKDTLVEPPFTPDYGCNIVIGEETAINFKYAFFFFIFSSSVPLLSLCLLRVMFD